MSPTHVFTRVRARIEVFLPACARFRSVPISARSLLDIHLGDIRHEARVLTLFAREPHRFGKYIHIYILGDSGNQ